MVSSESSHSLTHSLTDHTHRSAAHAPASERSFVSLPSLTAAHSQPLTHSLTHSLIKSTFKRKREQQTNKRQNSANSPIQYLRLLILYILLKRLSKLIKRTHGCGITTQILVKCWYATVHFVYVWNGRTTKRLVLWTSSHTVTTAVS